MRRFYITLVLAFLSTLVCTRALAYDAKIDGIFYRLDSYGQTAAVTYETTSYNSYSGEVTIPETVTYNEKTYTVTTIGWGAFMKSENLTKVVLPETITTIENYAFQNSGLQEFNVPSGLSYLGDRPFDGTPWYNNQPDGLIYLGVIAYSYKGTMPEGTDFVIADGTEIIANSAFIGCTGMKSVVIPGSVKTIGGNAFRNCTGLTEINIPEGVNKIEELAFFGCQNLTSLHIPASVTSIGYIICGDTRVESITVDPNNSSYDSRNDCNAIIKTSTNSLIVGCKNSFIPNTVQSLGYAAFDAISGLKSIVVPESVTSIGDFMFSSCEDLESIVIEQGNPKYDSRDNCNAIIETATNTLICGCKASVIPNTVTTIGGNAFYSLKSLTSITIPSSVTTIMYSAFWYCGLTTLVVPETVKSIDIYAFSGVYNVFYSGSATGSPWGAYNVYATTPDENGFLFSDDTKTKLVAYVGEGGDVIIPDGVTIIDNYAFKNYPGITTITVPASVTSIGYDAFLDVPEVTYFGSASGSPWGALSVISSKEASMDDFEFADEGKTIISKYIGAGGDVVIPADKGIVAIGKGAFQDCTALTSVVIPDGVTTIGQGAFARCSNLTKAAIPGSVDSIAPYAFNRTALETLEIPEGLQSIEPYTFCNIRIKSITFPSSVKIIKEDAFYGCTSLEEITFNEGLETIEQFAFVLIPAVSISLPASLKSVHGYSFSHCNSLSSIKVAEGNETYDSRDNCNAVIQKSNNELVVGCTGTVIPNSVTAIGNGAFYQNSHIREINLPEGLARIEATAFSQCNISKITIPSSLTSLSGSAFEWCPLESITVAEGNTMYDSRNDCNAVIETATNTLVLGGTTTVIPNEVKRIGDYAFYGRSMEEINLPEDVASIGQYALGFNNMQSFILPNTVTTLGEGAFYGCENLSSIIIPESVKIIEKRTFEDCPSLETLDIPNSVTALGYRAFCACTNLKSITLGYRVQTLGELAFYMGYALESIYANSPVPPTCDYNVFYTLNKENCVIYVPEGSLDAYKEADQWKAFAHIEVNPNAPTPYYDVTYVVDGEVVKTDVVAYGETITLLEEPTKEGLYFSGWSGYPEDMIMPAHDITVTGTFSTTSLAIINTSHASDKKTYDMFGREVKTMQGGQLYLHGGKKLMVRP